MIEIIYNDSGKKGGSVVVKPPKNIRQIGGPRGRHKIYVEDYVYTFLHSETFEGESQKRAAVLIGKSEVSQDIRYTFISGAVSCEDFVFQEDGIVFDESCWEYIYKEIKQYFDSQEVVGWFLGMPGFPLEISPAMEAAHRKYFTGRDKVLFLSEPAEGDDIFYAYEQGILQKKEGYYIYYEKNLPMQEYMVCKREKSQKAGTGIEEQITLAVEDYATSWSPEEEKASSVSVNTALAYRKPSAAPPESSAALQNLPDASKESAAKDTASSFENAARDSGKAGKAAANDPFWNINDDTAADGNDPDMEIIQLDDFGEEKASERKSAEKEAEEEKHFFSRSSKPGRHTSADEALQSYRSSFRDKNKKIGQKKVSILLYTAASLAMVVLCVIGITTVNNYEKMKQVEETLSLISSTTGEDDLNESQPSGLMVGSIPGQVKPEETQKDQSKEKTKSDDKTTAKSDDKTDAGDKTNTEKKTTANTDEKKKQDASETGKDGENEKKAEGTQPSNTQDGGSQEGGNKTEENKTAGTQTTKMDDPGTGNSDTSTDKGAKEQQDSVQTAAQTYLEQGFYVVQPGDRLESICKSIYQTTAMLDKLCEVNNIEDVDKIYVGQRLELP